MILQRMASAIKRQNWSQVTIEILIVVIGIFLGLQVTEWNERRNDNILERAYLKDLKLDFEANRSNFDIQIARTTDILQAMGKLLEQADLEVPELPAPVLNNLFIQIHEMPTFNDTNPTYSNLTGSGDLRLITNKKLKNDLASYYTGLELLGIIYQTHELELVETFQPYIIENMDYRQVTAKQPGDYQLPPPKSNDDIFRILSTREFQNVLVQKWIICADILQYTRISRADNEMVLNTLNDTLGISREESTP